MNSTPLVIAHRGSSAEAAEHSLEAYERAIAEGADGLECDVRMTMDGHLVCVHDRRIDRVSDGYGAVSAKRLRDLRHHDFVTWSEKPKRSAWQAQREGLWYRANEPIVLPRFGRAEREEERQFDQDHRRRTVLTFESLLELVVDAGRPLLLAVETKHPTRYAGMIEQAVVDELRRFGLARGHVEGQSNVQVMSFSAQALRRMRVLAPTIPTVFLMERIPVRMREGTLPFGARIAGPGVELLKANRGFAEKLAKRGNALHVWTVDEPADIQLCRELGAGAIITNRPRRTREFLTSLG